MSFIDRVKIKLASGKGGSGAVHFHRSRKTPRAGPDGGDGGPGGHLILSPSSQVIDFSHLKSQNFYKAEDGKPGNERKKQGAKGRDLSLKVPYYTCCYDLKGQTLVQLNKKPVCFLRGGKGGKGNSFFKTSRRQAPNQTQPGEKSQQKKVLLEIKWMSDVCLIGLRASGKSSLVYQLYPRLKNKKIIPSSVPALFSIPLQNSSKVNLSVVDLPGLSPSTRRFLRQAERTQLLLFIISLKNSSPFQSYQRLKAELLHYDQDQGSNLSKKPSLIVLTDEKQNTTENKPLKLWRFFTVGSPINELKFERILKKYKTSCSGGQSALFNRQRIQELLDEILCKVK